jgi:hypothetical protein
MRNDEKVKTTREFIKDRMFMTKLLNFQPWDDTKF